MATLDATVGGSTSNAYLTVADATALLDMRLGTDAWDEATPEDQAIGLMWATQLLDTQCQWYGTPTTQAQALAWPQTGQRDRYGRPVPPDVIPGDVQRATATYALGLLTDASDPTAVASGSGIKSQKLGDTQITYFDPQQAGGSARPASQGIPAEVRALLAPYAQMAGGLTVRLLRT